MRYIIIGLGNYGSVLAEALTSLGHEVIGVDNDSNKVDQLKDRITTSYILDATDEQSLSILPLRVVDVVIVAIGEALGASIKVVALLKKNQVKHIFARALDSVHHAILEVFNLDKILTPERDAAHLLVQRLDQNAHVESLQIDKEYFIEKFKVPKSLVGYKYADLVLEREFQLKTIALLKSGKAQNSLGVTIQERLVNEHPEPDYVLCENDSLVCYGKYKSFVNFWKSVY